MLEPSHRRTPMRRYGATEFQGRAVDAARTSDSSFANFLGDGIGRALREAGLSWGDDFYLRLVVTERFPEDRELEEKVVSSIELGTN